MAAEPRSSCLPLGGYMAAKVCKLEEQFKADAPKQQQQQEGSCSSIFRGVAIYVNGYTDPTADELRRLMMLHGGQFHVYYSRSKTTHIIATKLPHSKIKELKGEKVVRPEWITDSIKAGHLLSHIQYQLYAKQKGLSFSSAVKVMECVADPGGSRRELENRVNGTARSVPDLVRDLRVNGTCGEPAAQRGQSPAEQPRDTPALANGHAGCHVPNGALKPPEPGLPPGSPAPPRPHPADCNADFRDAWGEPSDPRQPAPWHGGVRLNGTWHPAVQESSRPRSMSEASPGGTAAAPGAAHRPTEPGFISDFYSRSRLHHISTWKNEFTEFVNTLQRSSHGLLPGREKLRRQRSGRSADPGRAAGSSPAAPPRRQTCILHVDMDCFFVSVGIRHRPDLRGKPVAVTSNRGAGCVPQRPGANQELELRYYRRRQMKSRSDKKKACELADSSSPESPDGPHVNGVDPDLTALSMAEIASCSYEARQAGVKNGMFFGQAKQLCPGLQAVPYDFHAYKEVALAMYETLASYTHDIEAVSCDEALVDVTGILSELGVSPDEVASAIRAEILEKTKCTASIGMGSNILLARMATRRAKPNGQYYLKPEEVDDFIRDQLVTTLPGVGRSMGYKLATLGVRTCGDLQQVSMAKLQKEFGPKTGQTLFRFSRGLDDRPVRSERERKSVSAEMNYGIRFTQLEEAESFLLNLAGELQRRLQAVGARGRRLTLKVMVRKPGAPLEPAKFGGHGICDNLARTVNLDQATDSARVLGSEVLKLFHSMKLNVSDMRGVGMQVQQLVPTTAVPSDSSCQATPRSRSIKDMLLAHRGVRPGCQGAGAQPDVLPDSAALDERTAPVRGLPPPSPTPEPEPGTSKWEPIPRYNGSLHATPLARTRLNLSIEIPSPSQIDRSVLEALPADMREQVEQTYRSRAEETPGSTVAEPQHLGTLVLQIPEQLAQGGAGGIIVALPDFSQVDPEVFAALPPDLQEELQMAYGQRQTTTQAVAVVAKNSLLHLKQPAAKTKRRNKKNPASLAKKGQSPLKSRLLHSPAKGSPQKLLPDLLKHESPAKDRLKLESGPSTSSLKPDPQEQLSKPVARPQPSLAGAIELPDIKVLLRQWVTTISDPMEEDILQVVKYCTDLIEDKDLEKLDLVIKYMKRLMQQSVDSVWNMAFDFILDNVQVVVQQIYGSTLKIS
ncbi:DNA repair protein REV1 isoform X2 [Lepisosteus oculatus]|uniref:DNA repair protein REV1 isoform X2 n=1 Tax=Lepisosteus oculatus TaxID=7918 RepID=UPI0035F508FF